MVFELDDWGFEGDVVGEPLWGAARVKARGVGPCNSMGTVGVKAAD
jgi:hypothetical protein